LFSGLSIVRRSSAIDAWKFCTFRGRNPRKFGDVAVRTIQGYLRPVLFYFRLAVNTAKVGRCSDQMWTRTSPIAVGDLWRRTASLVLWTEFVADGGGMVLHGSFVLGFDHDARQRFRSPVTDDDAAGVLEVFFAALIAAARAGMQVRRASRGL
jgi:hypothetical protein